MSDFGVREITLDIGSGLLLRGKVQTRKKPKRVSLESIRNLKR